MKRKLTDYVVSGVMALSLLFGSPVFSRAGDSSKTVHERLGISPYLNVVGVHGRFVAEHDESRLNVLACIYSGDIKPKKTKNGYSLHGSCSMYNNLDKFKKIVDLADYNGDGVITSKEISGLERFMFKEFSK
jgi:hypothetical protein